jgi:iron(III) transport system ATP-binding protein
MAGKHVTNAITTHQLVKRFGDVAAVDHVDLEIQEGEFFTLLGPSGCGKTTTLRMIVGLEKPTEGEVYLGDRCLISTRRKVFVQPEKRDMGMVFQSYALWPHMTVFENVAYPLKLRHVGGTQLRERVLNALRIVGLEGLHERTAPALSGGQQQRVALARALVFNPRVLLLDEPLSNLDAKLRGEMRRELKEVQARVGVTMIYVTHDQVEALSLSDRIAIMNRGKVEHLGSPKDVYLRPATPFVQDFLGLTISLDAAVANRRDGMLEVTLPSLPEAPVYVPTDEDGGALLQPGTPVVLAVRPEQVQAWSQRPLGRPNLLPAHVRRVNFVGDRFEYTVDIAGQQRLLPLPISNAFEVDDEFFLEVPPAAVKVWPR